MMLMMLSGGGDGVHGAARPMMLMMLSGGGDGVHGAARPMMPMMLSGGGDGVHGAARPMMLMMFSGGVGEVKAAACKCSCWLPAGLHTELFCVSLKLGLCWSNRCSYCMATGACASRCIKQVLEKRTESTGSSAWTQSLQVEEDTSQDQNCL